MTNSTFILLLLAADPQQTAVPPESGAVIDTQWSLGDPAADKVQRVRSGKAAAAKPAARRQAKPRLFGRARVTNRGRSNKGGANVGVAVPF